MQPPPPPLILTDYCRERDPDLPWGYWLRVKPQLSGVFDEQDRRWASVRDALWEGRFGFAKAAVKAFQYDAQFDMIHTVLAAHGRGQSPSIFELAREVMGDEGGFGASHYIAWLVSQRLLATHGEPATFGSATIRLTDEGLAVMRMIRATRPPAATSAPRIKGRSEMAAPSDPPDGANPHIDLGELRYVVECEDVARDAAVVLIDRHPNAGRMPTQETIWSMTFARRDERDAFFAWMLARSDRWESWGEMAYYEGRLSAHLLASMFAMRAREEPDPVGSQEMPWNTGP
ncbi:hypothetical protein [Sphingomonas yantingensis]|uniref:Uncharacterized protein n=1 Tax=Sphingomonas yantingensis TaxID=1241761 RepID=A0A7W9AT11_9SPHN|nr:hypothetical protein [Sphingomonas yantingensis]MBB5700001.1 hypothetical protein [Sphingomonas yantingensis]